MNTVRVGRGVCLIMLAIVAAGCGGGDEPLRDQIVFNEQGLVGATKWTRGGISGTVYVREGETLASAPLQVGVIVSNTHQTARELHTWIREQGVRTPGYTFHDSGGREESCVVRETDARLFSSLVVCKTGVMRAACVEADDALDRSLVSSCVNSSACVENVCDEQWLGRKEALDLLAADVLSRR